MGFGNTQALYLLLFLIPLIIIYLIKAKPKHLTIPSLLFFSDDAKTKKYRSMLKKFLFRLLLLIQAIFIILVGFSASNPVIKLPIDAFSLNTVIVMDVSASMNTKEGAISRMDAGKQELLKFVKGSVSIVVAEENPIVLATNISSVRAKALVTNLDSKDTVSRLDSSILLANEILGKDKGNIVVYSDFLLNPDDDILAAKKIAEANDKRVVFLETGTRKQNLGWIALSFNRGSGEALIKNYGDRSQIVDARLTSGSKRETSRIEVRPKSVEKVSFEIEVGETVLELVQKDRLTTDDSLYIMNPYKEKVKILLITNNPGAPLVKALKANLQFEVQEAIPPVIPDLNHDIVIVGEVRKELLLPNTFRDIRRYKEAGGKVIVTAQKDALNYQNIMSLTISTLTSEKTDVCINIVNEFTSRISNPACFTSVLRYYKIEAGDESITIASTSDENPVFVLEPNLLFYGIIDDYSGFKDQINYPLFWDDLINSMLGRQSLSFFNYRTGDTLLEGNSTILLDKAGFTNIISRQVAVNLLDNQESDTFRDSIVANNDDFLQTKERVNLDVNIDRWLLVLAFLVLIFEIYYIKRRGDL